MSRPGRALPRSVSAALLVVVTIWFSAAGALAGSADPDHDERPTNYANAPEELVVDAPVGASGTLRHETGVVFDVRVETPGVVAPPLLWDGRWTLHLPGDTLRFRVGEPLVTDGGNRSNMVRALLTGALSGTIALLAGRRRWRRALLLTVVASGVALVFLTATEVRRAPDYGRQLNECWLTEPDSSTEEGNGDGPEFTVAAHGVRCSQSLMFTLAASKGYPVAEKAINRARDLLGGDLAVWGSFCHVAGDAAASGAVSAGADPRALMREYPSFCDYSVSHGVGAMVATLHPDDPGGALETICAPDPGSSIPAESYTSQCWHGGGMGLARLYRLDRIQGLQVCLSATDGPARLNCIEGLFAVGRDYGLRVDDGSWAALSVSFEQCAQLEADDPAFLDTCFRSGAIEYAHDISERYEDNATRLSIGTDVLRTVCRGLAAGPKRVGCWSGIANFTAMLLQREADDRNLVRRYVEICDRAPDDDGARKACYQRITLGLVKNEQLRNGLNVDELVALMPAEFRDEIEALLNDWLASIQGRSL